MSRASRGSQRGSQVAHTTADEQTGELLCLKVPQGYIYAPLGRHATPVCRRLPGIAFLCATSRQRSSATTTLPERETRARAELTADGWRQLESRGSGWSVGRRSLVSSSSARLASSCSARPRARATRSATSQVGLDVPRSRPRIEVASRSAASARASWVSPISSRRRRTARPRATCGVWLMRTPEPSVGRPFMPRDHVPGSLSQRMPDRHRQQKQGASCSVVSAKVAQ